MEFTYVYNLFKSWKTSLGTLIRTNGSSSFKTIGLSNEVLLELSLIIGLSNEIVLAFSFIVGLSKEVVLELILMLSFEGVLGGVLSLSSMQFEFLLSNVFLRAFKS